MSCGIRDILVLLCPGAQWSIHDDDLSTLQWFSPDKKIPTLAEINQAIAECQLRESTQRAEKVQAKIDLNSTIKTDTDRINAIVKYLDLDK